MRGRVWFTCAGEIPIYPISKLSAKLSPRRILSCAPSGTVRSQELALRQSRTNISSVMAVPGTVRRLTESEYLTLERAAPFKSEFFDGEMFAMAGGSPMHSLIAANLIGELRTKLKGGPCKLFTSDLRLKVEATGLFTYPDVSVVCGPLQFASGTDDTVVNP